jgi:7-cyano-7-deazaguanine synthase
MFYGQKHDKELKAARDVAAYYGVAYKELDLSLIFADSKCSLLSHSEEEIPTDSYAQQLAQADGKPVSTYVPFRNGLFLASAASIALSNDCTEIYYGAHSDDAAGAAYPDCSEVFNMAMSAAIFEGSGQALRVHAPFVSMTKAEVVKTGLELNAPYHLTWSCYEGKDTPCGKCGTCIDRAKTDSTIIRRGVKLDNLIQIGHNVQVGENTVSSAQTGIAGTSKVGRNCFLAGQVGIADHITVGDFVKIGSQSGIDRDVPSGEVRFGSPALKGMGYYRSFAVFKVLPELSRKVETLAKELEELKNK